MKNMRKFFDTFDVPLLQIPGGHAPVLIINGEVTVFALFYARELQRLGYANGTIERKLESIGRLWDFYLSTPKHMHDKSFLKAFCEARIHGTVQPDGSDSTGLYWTPPQYDTAMRDFRHVSDYIEFAAGHFDAISLNPKEKAYQGSLEYARQHERKKKHSLLYFSTLTDKHVIKRKNSRIDRYGKSSDDNIQYKFFPPHKTTELINVMTSNRDKMIVMLLAFGGIRISELLHLHVVDVRKDKDGTAKIALVNPVEGTNLWIEKKEGKEFKRKGTRRQYLAKMHGLLPRNIISTKDGLYLGWKGMAEDDGTNHVSYVEWTVKEIGQAFYSLHKQYIKERAAYGQRHPYYFVVQTGQTKGQPLRMTSLVNHLKNKFQQIGLDSSDLNVGPHALRHYYGYFAANVLGLSADIVQEMMHHRSRSSTERYYKLTKDTVRKALENAYKKMATEYKELACLH
ncbi:tyrosine-type recombinase/integrase [Sulfurovum sp.]|uniref:tyrosine-type recombinase/integrase n=1 Tax=Sulfurovum sp. TaxID=1969726 RepID=UPI003568CC34